MRIYIQHSHQNSINSVSVEDLDPVDPLFIGLLNPNPDTISKILGDM
jgi:hypothetical protein